MKTCPSHSMSGIGGYYAYFTISQTEKDKYCLIDKQHSLHCEKSPGPVHNPASQLKTLPSDCLTSLSNSIHSELEFIVFLFTSCLWNCHCHCPSSLLESHNLLLPKANALLEPPTFLYNSLVFIPAVVSVATQCCSTGRLGLPFPASL